jgi:hypothetical protein
MDMVSVCPVPDVGVVTLLVALGLAVRLVRQRFG